MLSRKLFYIPAFFLVLLAVVPLFIDFSDYAAPYIADARKVIGRKIETGTIRIQILPSPRIRINDVVLGNAPNASKPEMVKIKKVEIILSLFDLLKGKIAIKSVDINTPEINLEKNEHGKANWEFDLSTAKTGKEKETKDVDSEPVNASAAGFVVRHLNISNATVHYLDRNEETTRTFSNLNIESSSEELMGPYKLHIRTDSNADRIDVEMLTGMLNLYGKTQLEANVAIKQNDQKVMCKLTGAVDISKKQFTGKFKASSVDFPLTIELPNQKIDLKKSIDASGEIQASPEHIKVRKLSISHPVIQMVGGLDYDLQASLFAADLKLKHQEDSISINCSTRDFKVINYHLSSSNYDSILRWLSQTQQLKGKIDAGGVFESRGALLGFSKTRVQIGDAIANVSGHFNTETKQTDASVHLNNAHSWCFLLGHDIPFTGPAGVMLELTPEKDTLAITAKLEINSGNIFFDGSLGANNFVKGNLTLQHINLSGYDINLKSNIAAKPSAIDLDIQNIAVKDHSGFDLSAVGKLAIDLGGSKPHISGSITAQPIQLTAYRNDQVYLARTLYVPEIGIYDFMQIAANANSRWSSTPIKLPLNEFTMNLSISVPKLALGGLVFEVLQSEITLSAGKLAVPFSAHMYGGKLNGALLVESAKGQNINLSAKFDGISIEKIKSAAAHFKQGKVSGQFELKTYGNSQYDWVSKLQGQAQFGIKDGVVKGFDLHKIVGLLRKPKNLLDLNNLQGSFSGNGETAFSRASGKFNVINGVASTNDLIIEATDAQLKAEGQADILHWNMGFRGEVSSSAFKDIPPIKFTIKGPLDQPSYNLDLKQIQQLFLQKGAGDLISNTLGKVIPGLDKIVPGMNKKSKDKSTEANSKGAPETDKVDAPEKDQPIKPEKVVTDLLKGIFK